MSHIADALAACTMAGFGARMFVVLTLACTTPKSEDSDSAPLVDSVESGETGSQETGDSTETADSADSGETSDSDSGVEVDADGDGSFASVDCDDADPGVHPGAAERCDGVDSDCDGDAMDAGVVTWTSDAGVISDVSAAFLGPGLVTLDSGTYDVCAGTYSGRFVTFAGVVTVIGHDLVTFDPDGAGTVFTVENAAALALSTLTVQDGVADYPSSLGFLGGGGVACSYAEVVLDGVTLVSNYGEAGGGVLFDHCEGTVRDAVIDDNSATFGGGFANLGGTVAFSGSTLSHNSGSSDGGAGYLEGDDVQSSAQLVDCDVVDNFALNGGGFAEVFAADVSFTGAEGVTEGIRDNIATRGGAVSLFSAEVAYTTFTSVACDFGSDADGDANSPDDVYLRDYAVSYSDFGNDADLDCDWGGCY